MAMLSKLFGRTKPETAVEAPACPHKALVPRWDDLADMGKKDRVSAYTCTACGSTFTREEGVAILGE
jgi:transposase-like protein